MRVKTTLLAVAMAACAFHPSNAQWGTDIVNKAINWELQVWESEYTGSGDVAGLADPTIITECFVNGATLGSGCKSWDCAPPCFNDTQGPWWTGIATPHNASLALYSVAFESDGVDDCVYDQSVDDHYWAGYLTLRDGLADMPIIYPSPDFVPCQWNPWLASGTTWLMPNSEQFDQRMELTWRYTAGDGPDNMLDFGTVTMNTTRTDVNSNRPLTGQYGIAPLQYSNVQGSDAADVYYKFHIDQPSTVTISTDDALTDFDTELFLYSLPGGASIASDDQSGDLPNTSTIVMQLCAGDYQVRVTGWSAYAGLFHLNVTVQEPILPTVSVDDNPWVSCADANDGLVAWATTGGVAPMQYWVNGIDVGNSTSLYDLAMGEHLIEVIDACGSTASESVTVSNADTTLPSALCTATMNINVIEGQNTLLTPAEVDNGSSDNCGTIDLSVAPNSFSTSDAGVQTVVLTVTDENSNTSTCTCVALVQNVTGIAEMGMSSRIRILPNPSNGQFRIDLSGAPLSSGTRLTIVDAIGRTVHASNVVRHNMEMDLGHLPDGSYMLRLNDPQWDALKRIIIQH